MPAIEVTTKIGCPNGCGYCPQAMFVGAYSARSDLFMMSLDMFKSCIDRVPPHVTINFSGMCEPWSNPDCTRMLLYAHKKGHRIEAITTFAGMSTGDIELLEQIPFTLFFVHLPSADGLERINVDDRYLTVLRRMLKSRIGAVYHYHGRDTYPEIKKLVEENGKVLRKAPMSNRAGNLKEEDGFAPAVELTGPITCSRGMRQNVLLPNGEMILCCMDYGMRHILGSLMDSDYDSLFRGAEFLKVMRGMKGGPQDILCRQCDVYAHRRLNIFGKIYWRHLHYLKNVDNPGDLYRLTQKVFSRAGRITAKKRIQS